MSPRTAATLLFSVIGFILLAMASGLISANVRKLADRHGWDNFLIRGWDQLAHKYLDTLPHWGRLQRVWWLWFIFGASGGIAVTLWASPILNAPAKAVVRELPPDKTTSPPQQAVLETSPALSNPLHDDAVKYLFVRDVKAALKQQQIPAPGCHIILVHYAMPYSENFAIEFKELFGTVLGWPVDDRIATTTLPRGLSIRSTEDEPSASCAKYMDGRLRSRLTWRNGSMPVDLSWVNPAEMSEHLSKCDGCVEIGMGNPPE